MRRVTILAFVALVSLAACGEDNAVGEGVDLNIKDQAEGARLGETTTTVTAAEAPDQQRVALGDTTTTTAAPATTTTAPPERVALTISINSDSGSATQFSPSAARVFRGSLVEWVNNDTVARSVVADDGAFDSGMIAPGGAFRYRADTAGTFNYTDGTRPYAVGTLDVVPPS